MTSVRDRSLNLRFWVILATTPKLLHLVWQAAPLSLLVTLAVTTSASILPIAWLYVNKLIIDELTAVITQQQVLVWSSFGLLVGIRFGLDLFRAGLNELRPYISQVLGDRFSLYANQKLLEQAIRLDLEHYESPQFHEALSLAQQSGSSYPVRALNNFMTMLGLTINFSGVLVLLIQFNPAIVGLLLLTSLPTLGVGVTFSNKGFAFSRKQTFKSRLASYFQGLLIQQNAAKEIRLFNLGHYFLNQWRQISTEHYQELEQLSRQRSLARFQVGLLPMVGFYGAYSWVIIQAVRSRITLGDFTMYAGAFSQAQSLLSSMIENISTTYESNLYVSQYLDFLQIKPQITDPPQPQIFPIPIAQGIQFHQVSFTYPGATKPTLKDITLTIQPEECIALVGVNGVGKTTLIKLLTRLYEPTTGWITIDGIPLADFSLADLRHNIAVLFQDFTQYKLSLADNIDFGDITVLGDRERREQAATAAGIADWVQSLPQGYDTKLGNLFPKGRELSGGQWQKVGLARAFMSQAQILILDEPTAAMDAIAEAALFERFQQLTAGRTTLFTSHRFATVRLADRIVVLDQGQIIEMGTHEALLEQAGLYAQMFHVQAQGYQ